MIDPSAQAAQQTPHWQSSGEHRFYLRGDVLYWQCHGPMQLKDVMAVFEQRAALQRQHGRVFLLFDAHAMAGIPPESRKYAIQFKPDPPIQGAIVVLGASLIARTAVSLIVAAARLLGRPNMKTVFYVDDEAAAWAIFDRERTAMGTG